MTRWTDPSDEFTDPYGDVLTRVLHDEARTIVPAGDGLTRIRAGVARRRRRTVWVRSTLTLAGAGLAAAGAFAGFQLSGGGASLRTVKPPATQPGGTPNTSSTAIATPTATPSSTATSEPVTTSAVAPIWPFASYAEAAAWRTGAGATGAQPWHLDAAQTALQWARTVVPGDNLVVAGVTASGSGSAVALSDLSSPNGQSTTFTVVHVARYGGSGSDAPYEVTGADAPYTKVQQPASGSAVSSPLTVSLVSVQGVDESFEMTVWNGTGDRQLGTGLLMAGQGPASGSVTFSGASAKTGYLTLLDRNAAGSGVTRLAAVAVTFGAPATGVDYPATFVAVKNGRVAVFYSKGGGFVRYLTPAAPGGGVQAVQITDDRQWVYYAQGAGSCAVQLMRVKYDGSAAPQQFLNPGGGPATGFAVSPDGRRIAYTQSGCSSGQVGAQVLVWQDLNGNAHGAIAIPATPPLIQTLAWSPDDRHLAVTLRTGNLWGADVVDTATAKSYNDMTAVPGASCGAGAACSAPAYAPDGSVVYATTDGATVTVYRTNSGAPTKLFSVASNVQVPALDLTADGHGVLLSDGNSSVWRWTAATGVHKISVSATGASW